MFTGAGPCDTWIPQPHLLLLLLLLLGALLLLPSPLLLLLLLPLLRDGHESVHEGAVVAELVQGAGQLRGVGSV